MFKKEILVLLKKIYEFYITARGSVKKGNLIILRLCMSRKKCGSKRDFNILLSSFNNRNHSREKFIQFNAHFLEKKKNNFGT